MRIIKQLIKWLFCIYVMTSLLIPASIVNKICFIGILFLYTLQLSKTKQRRIISISPVVIVMIYFYGFAKSLVGESDFTLAFQFLMFSVTLILIYPIFKNDIDVNKIVKKSGIMLAISTFLLYIMLVLEISFFGSEFLTDLFQNYGLIAMGYRGFFGNDILFVHFGTVPFLFLPGCLYVKDYLKNKSITQLALITMIFAAIFLSTSRALILGFILTVFILIILNKKGFSKIFTAYFFIVVSVLAVLYLVINSTVFDVNDYSNRIKIEDAKSFIDQMTVETALIGNGLATYYYAAGRGRFLSHTENTLFDTIRYFGVIFTFLIYYSLIIPTKKLKMVKSNKDSLFIFLIYLVMSLTNPILFNSFGGIVILWYWYSILKVDNS